VIHSLGRFAGTARARLAALTGLGWLRLGRFDLAVPAAAVLTTAGLADQLGRRLGPPVEVPFGLAWLLLAGAGLAALGAARSRSRTAAALDRIGIPAAWPMAALVVWIVAGWLVYDLQIWQGVNHLYDFDVYLGSAGRWLAGGPPYMTGPESSWPTSPLYDYFLYPPPLLPFFGLLSELPKEPLVPAWLGCLVGATYAAFRTLGLRRVWSLVLLAFPPVMFGFESGNVAGFVLLLFALGYRAGGALVVDGLFKVQTGLPALWLLRERRGRALLAGVAAIAAVSLATLPIVGLGSWGDWLAGLSYRSESQPLVNSLYGYSYARILPGWGFALLAGSSVGLALLLRGRRGLAALGLASIAASPALWPHGFAFALPAVLMLESGAAVWLVLGAAAVDRSMWLLFWLGWLAVLAAPRPPDARHPMAGTDGPWPGGPDSP
jgi:hypothetical protein